MSAADFVFDLDFSNLSNGVLTPIERRFEGLFFRRKSPFGARLSIVSKCHEITCITTRLHRVCVKDLLLSSMAFQGEVKPSQKRGSLQ